ncbi:aldo/keto reductase [Sphingomonas sp. LR61]
MTGIEHRPLGPSGLVVSTVGLGCNNFGRPGTASESQEGTDAVVRAALDAGVTLFDTADIYGGRPGMSEEMLGRSIAGRRDEIVLATKFGMDMQGANGPDWGVRGSRRYVRLAVESSLRRLGTDWIDLYQMHRPDDVTPIEETLSVLDDLVREGKIRYIGHSNFAGWQIAEAELTASIAGTTAFVSAQNEYSPLARAAEAEVLPAVRAYALGFLPFFPLYNGLLTGKYTKAGVRPTGVCRRRSRSCSRTPRGTCSTTTSASATTAASRCCRRRSRGCSRSRGCPASSRGRRSRSRSRRTSRPAPRGSRPRTTSPT